MGAEVYELAIKDFFAEGKSKSSQKQYKLAFKNVSSLHSKKIIDIRTHLLQSVLDNAVSRSKSSISIIVVLFHLVFKFAMQNDYIKKDYSQFVKIRNVTDIKARETFDEKDIKALWDNYENDLDKVTLILLYTGFRINELLQLKRECVNLSDGYLQGGLKTAAGKDRIVPIHHKILPLIEYFYNKNSNTEFLLNVSYKSYRRHLRNNNNHTPHETRHTFTTLLQKYDGKRVWIDKIIGHSSGNLTDDLYTHADFEELKKTVELLP